MMKPLKLLLYSAVIAFVAITVFSLSSSQPEQENIISEDTKLSTSDTSKLSYTQRIDSLRNYQQEFMRSDEKSPFKRQKKKFKGLHYFPIDSTFKVEAEVEVINMGKVFNLATSDGGNRNYQEVARLHFELKGLDQELMLLQSMDKDHYFLPFFDETSAESTYGAGRYLEVDYSGQESAIILDFNLAYNPYCAYVSGYSCPVPPAENQITVAETAGEKSYK